MKVSKLKLNPQNPRRISPEHLDKLSASIQQFPKMMELRPIIYDPETMQVLGGNQRLLAIRKLKMTEIPDTWARPATDLTPKEMKEFILKDNIPLGEWNFEILEADFSEFDFGDFGIEIQDYLEYNSSENKEVDTDIEFKHKCPKCGFEFND